MLEENNNTEKTNVENNEPMFLSQTDDQPDNDLISDDIISQEPSENDSETPESIEELFSCNDTPDNSHLKKASAISSVLDYVELFAFAICLVILIFSFCARLCTVIGPSMEKTLFENEMLIVSNIGYKPERRDIIVFHQSGGMLNEPVVKRVIALGGETVDIDFETWTVTVTDRNGNVTVLDETYVYIDETVMERSSQITYPYKVPEGHIFVMGDNRRHSTDSRENIIGPVDERRILGKVLFRVAPIDKIGKLD